MLDHSALCLLGERWLRRHGCRVVLREFVAATRTGEKPDVIGWRAGHSILIECKTSKADFRADASKPFRASPDLGMGDARLYLAPDGILSDSDIPDAWGLLLTDGKRIWVANDYPRQYQMQSWGVSGKMRACVDWHPLRFAGNKQCETVMLVSALSRKQMPPEPPT